MQKKPWLTMLTSILLIGIGVLSLVGNLVFGWAFNVSWPLVILLLGFVFYVLAGRLVKEWPWADLFYIPGSFLLVLGVIFLLNVITGDWSAWAYAWLLLICGSGLGVALANQNARWPKVFTQVGVSSIIGGITLFILFGAISRGRFLLVMAPILLVLSGIALRWLRLDMLLPDRLLRRFKHPGAGVGDSSLAAPDQKALVEPLSARELEVLRWIDQGLSNPEIAEKLSLAPSTVKTHINNIYGKLAVQTRVQALNRAKELGVLH
jgi:DNA-binding CsgD family transcriptional regulator